MSAYPKYRVNCWFKEADDTVTYGVDIKTDKLSHWRHLASGNKPLFFGSEDEAKEWIKQKRRAIKAELAKDGA